MATKTISLTERAYERLAQAKQEGESFTDVVIRLTRGRSLTELSGILDEDAADALAEAVEASREDHVRRREHRLGDDT